MVLQLETDVSWFVVENQEPQFIFTGEMSSYQRLLAHRVAQHWGLDTSIIQQGPDQGRILATRTPRTGPPRLKLVDVPISLAELTSWPTQQRYYQSGPQGMGGPTPRVLVRRRPDRGPLRRGGPSDLIPSGHKLHFSSNEDRELVYARARARIFANSLAAQQGAAAGEEAAGQALHGAAPAAAPPAEVAEPAGAADAAPADAETPRAAAASPQNAAAVRKAQLRNKQEDLADPDFRGRGKGSSPWYEEYGDGQGPPQGMYLTPAFSGEYSDGGRKSGPVTPHGPSSSGMHAGMYSSPYPAQMMAMAPYHVMPGQGMVPAGPPHMAGGMAVYAAGPGGSMPYAMHSPSAAAAYLPMPAYGFVPVHPRGDGEGMLAAGGYAGVPVYAGGAGSPMAGAAYAVPAHGVPAYGAPWQGLRPAGWPQQPFAGYGDRGPGGRGGYHRQGRGRGRGSGYSPASGSGRVFSAGTISTVSNLSSAGTNEGGSSSTPRAQAPAAPASTEGVGENNPPPEATAGSAPPAEAPTEAAAPEDGPQ
ncbi:hypothetical protein QBZ16_002114 [Prototheca wickerhamii]|uniref:R3H domain-containing protein n=1 Tax=Prototheca wickerhamii TaxID=3111 RepID=A0AAD9IM64_PROWI|nr:hypothetical protein QBZ16_002114 [Prototheca wickerhamii]